MALTSVSLSQEISANFTAEGIQTFAAVGGVNTLTDAADIAFEITAKCTDTNNSLTIHYKNNESGMSNKPTLHASNSDGGLECNQAYGAAKATAKILKDPVLGQIPVIAKIVAVYYEAPTTNTGIVTVTSNDDDLGDLTLNSAGASALIVPRVSNTIYHHTTFTFTATADVLKVVVLGNST
jgi:hypothetical protein